MVSFRKDFIVVYIRAIQGCNLNCTHCFTLGDQDPIMQSDLGDVESFLKILKEKVNPLKVVFYIHGGETFLADMDHLYGIVDLIHSIFHDSERFIIPQTNLIYKLDQDKIDFLRDQCNSDIGVSWDEVIRYKNIGQEDLFFRNFNKLVEEGMNVNVSITVQKHLLKADPYELLPRFDGAASIDFELLTAFDDKTNALRVNNLEWSDWLNRCVDYYVENEVTWSLPIIDLFTKNNNQGTIHECKCNCCEKRTFTLNADGTVGLCPDNSYYKPLFKVKDMVDWDKVEEAASDAMVMRVINSGKPELCYTCEHYDICAGNCELTLFDDTDECPMSRRVLSRIRNNVGLFRELLKTRGMVKLTELKGENNG